MKNKVRWVVYGSYSGWDDFLAAFDDELDAKLYAVEMLGKGCEVTLHDTRLNNYTVCALRYDGLGQS
jgi:hypothetical protein